MQKSSILIQQYYFANTPQISPPIRPKPKMGPYCLVTIASGRLNIKPVNPPFNHPGIGKSKLKIIKPIQKRLMKEADMALALFSKDIKIIGISETIPNITPAITPFIILLIIIFA